MGCWVFKLDLDMVKGEGWWRGVIRGLYICGDMRRVSRQMRASSEYAFSVLGVLSIVQYRYNWVAA